MHWTIQDARELYNISRWGNKFFDINERGHVVAVNPKNSEHPGIDLCEVMASLSQQGVEAPVLLRFPDFLQHQIQNMTQSFGHSRARFQYAGDYIPVYPIKVNQQSSVVTRIAHCPDTVMGLEAGSKTELMVVLAMAQKNAIIVCNGYKDREYLRLALIGNQLGHRVFIVVEKLSELALLLEVSRALEIAPHIGLRIRLSSVSDGRWQNSGGEKSKFGLNAAQVMEALNMLQQQNCLKHLNLIHVHLGSQIPSLMHIKSGLRECARYLQEMKDFGCQIDYVDVGGGLGIDYEGSQSNNYFSRNYSLQEYADTIVSALGEACDNQDIKHPNILTESGRALTAHHAVLITNVLDIEQAMPDLENVSSIQDDEALAELLACNASLDSENFRPLDCYQSAHQQYKFLLESFNSGQINLAQRAAAEKLYASICRRVVERLDGSRLAHREIIDAIRETQAQKFFCNFSLFQSLPDIWALKQIFPIMPIQRLHEYPQARAVLHDITCDSDGRIDDYVDSEGIEHSLPVHQISDNENYALGFFLVGAYQEILGDMHNLFGDTHAVNVLFNENGFELSDLHRGDSVDYILRHIRFDPNQLLQQYKSKLEQSSTDAKKTQSYLVELSEGLSGYSYLES